MRLPTLGGRLGGWNEDPVWATVYEYSVTNDVVGPLLWRLGIGSDRSLLDTAAAELGRLPAGTKILDIPCGGGVAMSGLRPSQGVDYLACDISRQALLRTQRYADKQGVGGQLTTQVADVSALPFAGDVFDVVASFTGLHCFPDPRRGVLEMTRVLKTGGMLTGSAFFSDSGVRFEPLRKLGRVANVLGPMCTVPETLTWLQQGGITDVEVTMSGGLGYFRGVKA